MIQVLLALVLVAAPDPSTRSRAWRVVDTVVSGERCDFACSLYDTADPDRDTACIQAAIERGVLDRKYNSVELPPGECYVNSALEVLDTRGFEMYGHGPGRTTLYWDSGAPADPLLYLGDVTESYFHDFEIQPGDTRTITNAVVVDNCDECYFTAQGTYLPYAPGHNRFERLSIGAPAGTHTLVNGFVIEDGVDPANNEFHSFRDVMVSRHHGDAWRIEGEQHKTVLFDQCTCLSDIAFLETTTCVRSDGCFVWTGGGGGYHDVDFYLGSQGCQTSVRDANLEGSLKFIFHGGNTSVYSGLVVQGSRWAANSVSASASGTDRYVIQTGYSGSVVLLGNVIGDYTAPKPLAIEIEGSGASSSIMLGNALYTSLDPTAAFPGGVPWLQEGNNTYDRRVVTGSASTNRLTFATNHELFVDKAVYLHTDVGGTLPSPLVANTLYYVESVPTATTITLKSTLMGSVIDLTTDGTGTFYYSGTNVGLPQRVRTLENAATPTVKPGYVGGGSNTLLNVNNGTTTVTDFYNGFEGQVVTLWGGGSAGRTITHNGTDIALRGGVNMTLTGDDVLVLQRLGGVWTEIGRSADDLSISDTFTATDGSDSCTVAGNGTIVATTSVTSDLIQSSGGVAQLTTSGVSADDVYERTSNEGVTIEGVRVEDTGSDTYEVSFGGAGTGTRTASIMGGNDTSAPYSLAATVYGDVDVRGALTSTSTAEVLSNAYVGTTPAGTAGFETLHTVTIPAGRLAATGDTVRGQFIVSTAANGNTKNVRARIAGVDIFSDALTTNNGQITYWFEVRRTGASAGKTYSWLWYAAGSLYQRNPSGISPTWANAVSITFEIHTPTANTDATMETVRVVFEPAR